MLHRPKKGYFMSGVGSESREAGYPWMGKLGEKIGESQGVEEVSPADENDTCPDGSWAGPLGKPQEVSPAPMPTPTTHFEIIKYNAMCWKVYLGNSYLGAHNTEQQA